MVCSGEDCDFRSGLCVGVILATASQVNLLIGAAEGYYVVVHGVWPSQSGKVQATDLVMRESLLAHAFFVMELPMITISGVAWRTAA